MVEVNSRKLLTETNIGGHDYLRNLVQLPFFLQNSGLRKVRIAQKCSQHRKSFSSQMLERTEDVCFVSLILKFSFILSIFTCV